MSLAVAAVALVAGLFVWTRYRDQQQQLLLEQSDTKKDKNTGGALRDAAVFIGTAVTVVIGWIANRKQNG